MFRQNMRYEVEWETKDGAEVRTLVVFERSAVRAETKAESILKNNPEFGRIDSVDLDD